MAVQLSLFDTSVDRPLGVQREYQGVSGLSYLADLLTPVEQLQTLREIDSSSWIEDLKRRVQHYGYRYDYKSRRVNTEMFVGPLPDFVATIGRSLVSRGLLSHEPDQVIVNEYLPGQGIAHHIDCEPCFGGEIATVSLGAEYPMELIECDTSEKISVQLETGSCLVLSGDARYCWKHGIRPRKSDEGRPRGRRVSLTFRKVILATT